MKKCVILDSISISFEHKMSKNKIHVCFHTHSKPIIDWIVLEYKLYYPGSKEYQDKCYFRDKRDSLVTCQMENFNEQCFNFKLYLLINNLKGVLACNFTR